MPFENAQALEAACLIRSLLPTKFDLNSDVAKQIDTQLASILNQTNLDENMQIDQLLEILDSNPQTKAWLDSILDAKNEIVEMGSSGLAGDPTLPLAQRYRCPSNDYVWYLEDNREVPLCPTHLVSLVKS